MPGYGDPCETSSSCRRERVYSHHNVIACGWTHKHKHVSVVVVIYVHDARTFGGIANQIRKRSSSIRCMCLCLYACRVQLNCGRTSEQTNAEDKIRINHFGWRMRNARARVCAFLFFASVYEFACVVCLTVCVELAAACVLSSLPCRSSRRRRRRRRRRLLLSLSARCRTPP